eukprot:CAMPEP_0203825562 /NCGR_PEP_ID=MMETSP0115-20131106/54530_1 /ASSEMBLY_ACC=CAM_ASM_000227 /TAXON_ID=33651 /ORGANISM="Bicosoecid sp, Strain ms1" /LENGTH=86 /DNA_ID=CAMNT_0050734607 /DNA_START=96 /DNA_END=352 /DNA_ORIENTATION=+
MSDEEKQSYPLEVTYCGVCGLPPEYCKYGPKFKKCIPWLKANAPGLYPELADEEGDADVDAASAALASASVDDDDEGGAGGGAGGG